MLPPPLSPPKLIVPTSLNLRVGLVAMPVDDAPLLLLSSAEATVDAEKAAGRGGAPVPTAEKAVPTAVLPLLLPKIEGRGKGAPAAAAEGPEDTGAALAVDEPEAADEEIRGVGPTPAPPLDAVPLLEMPLAELGLGMPLLVVAGALDVAALGLATAVRAACALPPLLPELMLVGSAAAPLALPSTAT